MLDKFGFTSSDLRSKALITNKGAVLRGKFRCRRPRDKAVRVVAHAHADHILGPGAPAVSEPLER